MCHYILLCFKLSFMFFFNTRIFYHNSYSRPHSLDPFLILFVIAFMCTMSMSNHVNSLHLKWIRSLLFSIRLVAFIEILFFWWTIYSPVTNYVRTVSLIFRACACVFVKWQTKIKKKIENLATKFELS